VKREKPQGTVDFLSRLDGILEAWEPRCIGRKSCNCKDGGKADIATPTYEFCGVCTGVIRVLTM